MVLQAFATMLHGVKIDLGFIYVCQPLEYVFLELTTDRT